MRCLHEWLALERGWPIGRAEGSLLVDGGDLRCSLFSLLSTHLEVNGPLFNVHVHETRHSVAANVVARRRLYRHRAHILKRE